MFNRLGREGCGWLGFREVMQREYIVSGFIRWKGLGSEDGRMGTCIMTRSLGQHG